MRIIIEEVRNETIARYRTIAEWIVPDDVPTVSCFSQLATPDTTKVVTYRVIIIPD